METFAYHRDSLAVAVPRAHPLAARKAVRFTDLLPHEFIAPHSESSLFVLLRTQADVAGRAIHFRLQVSSFDAICRLIEANMGIGVLPEGIIDAYAKVMGIRKLPLREPWAEHQLYIGTRKLEALPAVTRALIDHLRRY